MHGQLFRCFGLLTVSLASLDASPAWLLVALACAGQFLVVLDVSVVNVALPSMRTDLGMSPSGLQWVVNAYSIAFAGFMLLGGRAGDHPPEALTESYALAFRTGTAVLLVGVALILVWLPRKIPSHRGNDPDGSGSDCPGSAARPLSPRRGAR